MPAGLADKVAFLRSLCGAGDEAIETHFAWVFLVGRRALKLRKPVRRDPMNYGSLEARRADSEAEVRLNRRLAPDVYLGTLPIVAGRSGALQLGGDGEIVDWLVEMRRLDRRWMLDTALERGAVTPDMLGRVAGLLAQFYAGSQAVIEGTGLLMPRLLARAQANHEVLATLDARLAAALLEQQRDELDRLGDELDRRAIRGCVVEAHGDLRPEHISVSDPPAVIDCLEFDRDLRVMDRAEELCFLALECARIGHATTGEWLLRECLRRLSDDASPALLAFYRGHRAATRAKLYAWRADEPDGGTPGQWRARALDYLSVAARAPSP